MENLERTTGAAYYWAVSPITNAELIMVGYLFIIFILAVGATLWSMRNFGKKHIDIKPHELKQGSIVIMDEKVQHYK